MKTSTKISFILLFAVFGIAALGLSVWAGNANDIMLALTLIFSAGALIGVMWGTFTAIVLWKTKEE